MAVQKNIIVCSDGTGNTAIKGRGTNVFKLFEAVDLHGHLTNADFEPQLAVYDDGVGTESFKPLKLLGGAFGWGLSRNVRKLYKELARVYDPGDRIFLFGFSRGAFTVRTLAGMILRCGIVDVASTKTNAELDAAVEEIYAAYRAGYESRLTWALGQLLGWKSRPDAIAGARRHYSFHPDATITFIGVWDTVDAVGLPLPISDWFNRTIYQFKFPTQDLSDRIEVAAQALSVDDQRSAFTPVLWSAGDHRAEQVWFAGVHSNVGGGYPKQGMSLVALEWLLQKARTKGLHVQQLDFDIVRGHASVHDKLYDPRGGLGVFYHWAPRRIHGLCGDKGAPVKIHVSVLERIANGTEDYAPGNLPFGATVVPTLSGDPLGDRFAQRRADAVKAVFAAAGAGRDDLLGDVESSIWVAKASYWVFLVSGLGLIAGPLLVAVFGRSWAWVGLGLLTPVVGLIVAWALAWYADAAMDATFSRFWHAVRPKLRDAFRRAREDERSELAASPKPPPPPSRPTASTTPLTIGKSLDRRQTPAP